MQDQMRGSRCLHHREMAYFAAAYPSLHHHPEPARPAAAECPLAACENDPSRLAEHSGRRRQQYRASNTERVRYYSAAASARDPTLASATLALTLSDELPTSLAGSVINTVPASGELAEDQFQRGGARRRAGELCAGAGDLGRQNRRGARRRRS